ncbi:MAG: hypothetical protein ACD_28C00200G0006 [uncultured bacterium]|nr:MAG: hypothetical protein ACD_28C00200G0006 [uncultured bacterium]KKT76834.1 MAG: hypothetical protein UW70_C0011G0005 [Candidatus Peregrinibacteria bacterium GW2011_GWA2_44_7]
MRKKRKEKSKAIQRRDKENLDERMTEISTSFSGPLPPPNLLQGYENILFGAADRIISMAEKQANHRQDLEKSVTQSNISNERMGMWMAFTLTVSLMGFGAYLILNDKNTAGYFAVFGPVVFHAANYIYNKRREEKVEEEENHSRKAS